jgi:exosome complex exonuclease DIS3/RRP44
MQLPFVTFCLLCRTTTSLDAELPDVSTNEPISIHSWICPPNHTSKAFSFLVMADDDGADGSVMEEDNDNVNNDNDDDDDDDSDHAAEMMIMDVELAPELYQTQSFFRQTRKRAGRILKSVKECYLRDDLGFGSIYQKHAAESSKEVETIESVEALINIVVQNNKKKKSQTNPSHDEANAVTDPTTSHAPSLLVCDTNVLLHNLDVLERLVAYQVMLVIPQTALLECKNQQRVAYDRTVELIRSGAAIFFPDIHHVNTATTTSSSGNNSSKSNTVKIVVNDVNDARIRNVAKYLSQHLKGSHIPVILLTDDVASRALAKINDNVVAHSVQSYVNELASPLLSDLVAQFHQHGTDDQQDRHRAHFPPHLTAIEITKGIQTGKLHRGIFRKLYADTAAVMIRQGNDRVSVTIPTHTDQNRAVDGDTVAIQLHAITEWISTSVIPKTTSVADNDNDENTTAHIAPDTAEPTLADVMNVKDVVTLDDATERRPTGQVVGIIRRNFGSHCGSIFTTTTTAGTAGTAATTVSSGSSSRQQIIADHERDHTDGSSTCIFFPVDDRKVPPMIIRTTQRDRLLGQRIVVAMDSWPVDSLYPLGHYVRTIGPAGTKDVETDVLLQQHDIPHAPFSAAVLACLPSSNFAVQYTSDRMDLRHLPILSIDPPGCKDIDDALHCIELDNGNWQVGVHIADVTHYVKPGSAIDLEASDRSTSTYLVNKRLDMLPGLLTTDLCSLKGNVDRYAFSVLWEVTPAADIVNVEFKKSVIHSIAALTYQQAQLLIDQPDDTNDIQGGAVKRLARLARMFRKRRIDAGALTLASPEVKCAYTVI